MRVHLICNAHLDPAWLWELEEGAAEALATFRVAANFCEQYDGFVFNHNESILYEWVQEFDPELFRRIQGLVKAGKWHIMGGWYLQPDCNMPSGESFVRHILVGRSFFREHFDVEPTTAINFDPFGHTRGLVQILAKSGYDSYIHVRPQAEFLELPSDYYRWIGYDGSSVIGCRRPDGYNTDPGAATARIASTMDREADRDRVLVLWGVGNHGGGPSRVDVEQIAELQRTTDHDIIHSTPESFFTELRAAAESLPECKSDLNPWGPGCYTSQIRIKQKHRRLEADLFSLERMAVHAELAGIADYPRESLDEMQRDLLTSQFHDILPGSSIKPVEEASIRLLDHGLEIAARVKMRLFFGMARTLPAPEEGVIPVVAYNPGSAEVDGVWECEFQPSEQNWDTTFTDYEVSVHGVQVTAQVEHEASSLNLDWRKKIVFRAALPPGRLERFQCRPVVRPTRPEYAIRPTEGQLRLGSDDMHVSLNATTGHMDSFKIGDWDLLRPDALRLLVVDDCEDPWGSTRSSYRNVVGEFALMDPDRAAEYSGSTRQTVDAVRVVEDGPVRTVVEALFEYHDSACLLRYSVPKSGRFMDLEVTVDWREKNRMLKLAVPTPFTNAELHGQVAYGTQTLPADGTEVVTQRWQAIVDKQADTAIALIDNGVYGSDYCEGELRISLLHSPVYSALQLGDRPIVSDDRIHPRIDQGERRFRFRLMAGARSEVLGSVDYAAQSFNEPPYLLSIFTDGDEKAVPSGLEISAPQVICSALKQVHSGDGYILRLFNASGELAGGQATIAAANLDIPFDLGPYEVATYRFDARGAWSNVDLIERE
jgi:alpha-mannosidase